MISDQPVVICATCGNSQMVRVLWGCVHLCGQDDEDVQAGRAIFGSRHAVEGGPAWVCLTCKPEWGDVHRLALEEYRWQLAKEVAVSEANFDRAGELLQMQR